MTDYFKLAEAELNKVRHFGSSVDTDKVHISKAEVYAKLAYAQALKEK